MLKVCCKIYVVGYLIFLGHRKCKKHGLQANISVRVHRSKCNFVRSIIKLKLYFISQKYTHHSPKDKSSFRFLKFTLIISWSVCHDHCTHISPVTIYMAIYHFISFITNIPISKKALIIYTCD